MSFWLSKCLQGVQVNKEVILPMWHFMYRDFKKEQQTPAVFTLLRNKYECVDTHFVFVVFGRPMKYKIKTFLCIAFMYQSTAIVCYLMGAVKDIFKYWPSAQTDCLDFGVGMLFSENKVKTFEVGRGILKSYTSLFLTLVGLCN